MQCTIKHRNYQTKNKCCHCNPSKINNKSIRVIVDYNYRGYTDTEIELVTKKLDKIFYNDDHNLKYNPYPGLNIEENGNYNHEEDELFDMCRCYNIDGINIELNTDEFIQNNLPEISDNEILKEKIADILVNSKITNSDSYRYNITNDYYGDQLDYVYFYPEIAESISTQLYKEL